MAGVLYRSTPGISTPAYYIVLLPSRASWPPPGLSHPRPWGVSLQTPREACASIGSEEEGGRAPPLAPTCPMWVAPPSPSPPSVRGLRGVARPGEGGGAGGGAAPSSPASGPALASGDPPSYVRQRVAAGMHTLPWVPVAGAFLRQRGGGRLEPPAVPRRLGRGGAASPPFLPFDCPSGRAVITL